METTAIPAQLLGFTLGVERYGLPLDCVREICRPRGIWRVPGGPPSLVGLVNYRGEILPVFDAGAIMGKRRATDVPAGQVVIVRGDELVFGLSADSVCGIGEVSVEEPGGACDESRGRLPELVCREARVGDDVWRVVDVTRLLQRVCER